MTAKAGAPGPRGERIAKVLARAGLCSRREAERWIAEGRVAVSGRTLSTPAVTVTAADIVTVDGAPLPARESTRLWRYHKPAGLVTTHKDPRGRPTVFERLPETLPRVVSVGRLDLKSEGLLLLTNDGTLARTLELPATGWIRRYRVRVFGAVDEAKLAEIEKGVTVSGVRYGPIRACLDRRQGSNAWITVALAEGKNREVRKVMEHLGLTVNRLIRVAYGPFQLGGLARGEVEAVPGKVLKEQLGKEFRP
jgi:23S rRNA pseudouridine2605 synthase